MSCATHESAVTEITDEQSVELAIIDQTQWHSFSAEDDPLPEHEPETITCSAAGFYLTPQPVTPQLEIDTAYCNYTLLCADALLPLAPGVQVTFELWHFDLASEAPAQAHVALFFGSALEWETYIEIPSPAEVKVFRWRTEHALHAREPIRLHLHNHGQNTWVIAKLTALTTAPSPRAD